MIDTPYLIAAFAALFLISKKSKTPAFLCFLIVSINYFNESLLHTDDFIYYSLNSTILNLCACFLMLNRSLTKRTEQYAFLFLLTAFIDLTGGLFSNYYVDTTYCNLLGLCVILIQMMLLWSDRSEGLADRIVGTVVSIRRRLFI